MVPKFWTSEDESSKFDRPKSDHSTQISESGLLSVPEQAPKGKYHIYRWSTIEMGLFNFGLDSLELKEIVVL